MFNLFKSFTFTWQQVGVFKLALITIGMLLGAHFSLFVLDNQVVLGVVALLATSYTMYVAVRQ